MNLWERAEQEAALSRFPFVLDQTHVHHHTRRPYFTLRDLCHEFCALYRDLDQTKG